MKMPQRNIRLALTFIIIIIDLSIWSIILCFKLKCILLVPQSTRHCKQYDFILSVANIIFINIPAAGQLQSVLIPILSHLSRGSAHSCQGEISGELKLVAAYQIFKDLGSAKQQMQNTCNSLSVLPVPTGKLPDGGPEVASTPHLFTCTVLLHSSRSQT